MYTTKQIETIDDLFLLLKETRLLLNRGLSKASYHLKTTLYRTVAPTIVDISKPEEVRKHSNEITEACKRAERTILRTFAKYAANIDPHCEDNTPYAVWRQMVLGQHHGLPTRLLDWSQSPMVGLYFATNYSYFGSSASSEEDREEDCLLWQIDPEEIRALLPKEYKEEYEDEEKNDLFFTLKMLEDNEITLDDIDKKGIPIMIEPPSIDQRIVNQYSCFTALPAGMDDMEDFLKGTENSVKYVIPGELRWEIGKMLDICNIGERILFPGVDGVCMDIARYKKMYTNKPYGKLI